MKIIGVIPARYNSTRFPGKPLADICGKPMIWWVYNQAKQVTEFTDVYVATDEQRIKDACVDLKIPVIMTRTDHKTSTERVYEAACNIEADLYVVINGDEPLIDPQIIKAVIPEELPNHKIYVGNLMTEICDPVEVVDFTNIKVVTDDDSKALFFSRSPIPYPKSSMQYKYYKHVGVLAYNLAALQFFAETQVGINEAIEDINELRFVEHGVAVRMTKVNAHSLSVDTPKDLEKIREMIGKKLALGESNEQN